MEAVDDVEPTTLAWDCGFNTVPLHGTLDDGPRKHEAANNL